MMRFYSGQHRFYCGIDMHTRTLCLCVLDSAGVIVLEATLTPDPDRLLAALTPYRDGLVVGCECLFAWYWLADLCAAEGIPFVLGHALYLKAIHGGKTKTDVIDAQKLARPDDSRVQTVDDVATGLREVFKARSELWG
jgi:transposase